MKPQTITIVLCPVDFDVNSLTALDWAREFTRESDRTLHVLHVVTPTGHSLVSPFSAQRASDYARIRFDEIARESLGNADYCLHLKMGCPAEEIIKTAIEIDADLVVLATHSRPGVSWFFLGSVADKVVRASPCPVLTIHGTSGYGSERTQPPARS